MNLGAVDAAGIHQLGVSQHQYQQFIVENCAFVKPTPLRLDMHGTYLTLRDVIKVVKMLDLTVARLTKEIFFYLSSGHNQSSLQITLSSLIQRRSELIFDQRKHCKIVNILVTHVYLCIQVQQLLYLGLYLTFC